MTQADTFAQAAFLSGLRSGKLLTEAARHFVQVWQHRLARDTSISVTFKTQTCQCIREFCRLQCRAMCFTPNHTQLVLMQIVRLAPGSDSVHYACLIHLLRDS